MQRIEKCMERGRWKTVWKGYSSRLDSVTKAAIAGSSCGVMLVQVRLEEIRLGECGELKTKQ